MSPPRRSKLVLFTAIPFLLLSSSQSTVVRTVVYLDGSVKRVVSADFWQERRSNVLPHLRLALPQADRQCVAPIAEGLRGERSVIVASAAELEGAKLTYEDVVARPLSLFTYYTWTEAIEIPRETATEVEKADPSKAVFKYEVTMPGRVQEARALPRKAEPKPTGGVETPGPAVAPAVPPPATPPAPVPPPPPAAPALPAPSSEAPPAPSGAPPAPAEPAPSPAAPEAAAPTFPPATASSEPPVPATKPIPSAPPPVETAPSAPTPAPAAPWPEPPPAPSAPPSGGPAEAPTVPSTPPAAVPSPPALPGPPPTAAPTPPAAVAPPGPAAAPSAPAEAPPAGPSLQAEISGSTATFRLAAVHEAYDITVTSRRLRWGYVLTWLYVLAFIAYRLSAFLIHRARLRPRRI